MSDDEFAQLQAPPEPEAVEPAEPPPAAPPEEKEEEEAPVETPAPDTKDEEQPEPEPEAVPEPDSPGSQPEPKAEDVPPVEPAKDQAPVEPEKEDPPPAAEPPKKKEEPAPESEAKDENGEPAKEKVKAKDAPDYEGFFKRVMAPFKANGKTIQLESPEEVIQLMQMGANYTKKMQAFQKDKKVILMLEQNGLLDENEISFYIDLKKKDPEAIKKFLKDANIDPVDIDTSGEVKYQKKSHAVSDKEANLHSAIEDLNSMEGGKETLQSINSTWDETSKKDLWDHPEILAIIHAQRSNGMYAKIETEIERRRILGQMPNVPFLRAYKQVGDELAAKGAFQSAAKPAPSGQRPVARTPVAVRPAKTPATKVPDNKVKAAAAPRTVSNPAKSSTNFLAMSDEDFNKLANKV